MESFLLGQKSGNTQTFGIWDLNSINPLNVKFTKWSNTLKQFVGKLPTNCLSVFDHFVGLAFKGLRKRNIKRWFITNIIKHNLCFVHFGYVPIYICVYVYTCIYIYIRYTHVITSSKLQLKQMWWLMKAIAEMKLYIEQTMKLE